MDYFTFTQEINQAVSDYQAGRTTAIGLESNFRGILTRVSSESADLTYLEKDELGFTMDLFMNEAEANLRREIPF